MRRIIYLSTSRNLMSNAEIEEILAVSRRRNQEDQVTGLLVYHEGCFFQALEGTAQAVQTVFGRIKKDPRHASILMLLDAEVEARAFPDWSMGFVNERDLSDVLKDASMSLQDMLDDADRFIPDPKSVTLLRSFLRSFRYNA